MVAACVGYPSPWSVASIYTLGRCGGVKSEREKKSKRKGKEKEQEKKLGEMGSFFF